MSTESTDKVWFIPVLTETGDHGHLCEDCWACESPQHSHLLFVVWTACSIAMLLTGTVVAARLHPAHSWVGELVTSGGVYGALAILVAISVAVAVALTIGQIAKDQRTLDHEMNVQPTVTLERRAMMNSLTAGFTGELITVFVLGVLSGALFALLAWPTKGDAPQSLAAVLAFTVTLWIAFEFARLLAVGEPPDRLIPLLLMHSHLRATKERLQKLADKLSKGSVPFIVFMLALLATTGIGTTFQCHLVIEWIDPLVWGTTSLSALLLLTVFAIWQGRAVVLEDQRFWLPKVKLIIASFVLVLLSLLATMIGLLGSATMPETHTGMSLIVAFIQWLVSAALLCIILWGAGGYGPCRVLATPLVLAFTSLVRDDKSRTEQLDHPGNHARIICWFSWIPLPALATLQVVVITSITEQPVTPWLIARAMMLGLMFTALGRLSLTQHRRMHSVLMGISTLAQAVISSYLVMIVAGFHRPSGIIVMVLIGLIMITVFLYLFGPFPRIMQGIVGNALADLVTIETRTAYHSLTIQETAKEYMCQNRGCINCNPIIPPFPDEAPLVERVPSRLSSPTPKITQALFNLGAAMLGAWLVAKHVRHEADQPKQIDSHPFFHGIRHSQQP